MVRRRRISWAVDKEQSSPAAPLLVAETQRKKARARVNWPAQLARLCVLTHLPAPVLEYRFHPTRKWRFDLAWPSLLLAVEIDGGLFVAGRHSRGAGIRDAMEKTAHALMLGWRVMPLCPDHIKSGQALDWITQCIQAGDPARASRSPVELTSRPPLREGRLRTRSASV